jgi:folate-binding protein YgfZ
MQYSTLQSLHEELGARFIDLGGTPAPMHYGDPLAEHLALTERAGIADLSARGRLCLTGTERIRFLHGQVTNDVQSLRPGEGCYAALVSAKGKLESDLYLHCLDGEVLLDFEPGLTRAVMERLQRFIVADDVQIIDVAPLYGLITVQGPGAAAILKTAGVVDRLPEKLFASMRSVDPRHGEIYVVNQPRLATVGFDLFLPAPAFPNVLQALLESSGARICGWQALETARIEAGLPRFGMDMDESNFPQEAGIEARAVNYHKGCYIGQEVLNRIHTRGHVNRRLCGLRLAEDLPALPAKGDKLFAGTEEVGHLTSSTHSPSVPGNIALGYIRKGHDGFGNELKLVTHSGASRARVVPLPFAAPAPPPT